MDSGSQAAVDGGGGRSGGKILKRRPTVARKTPYDRPTPPLQPERPNWINGLFFPAKFVAGGASKLLSPFWNPKSWGSHSSSSDSGSDSEGGIEDDYEHDEDLVDDTEPNQNKGSSSGKSEILYLVEQLLMLEHYSREECDRLIKIINSRAVDYTVREGVDAGQKNPGTSNQAITEARKIITENMVGTSSKSDLENSIHGSKSLVTPNRDYLSGGSWNNIQNEIQQLHSKAIELMKPKEQNSLEAPKPEDETVNTVSGDIRITQDDAPTEDLSTLPSIKEHNQIAEEKVVVDATGDDLITEYAEVPDVNASQGSSNTTSTKEAGSPTVKRAVTRGRKYNTRRGRGRAK